MSKRSRRRQKRSASQVIFWIMSAVLASSMVISLIVVALQPAPAAPTPFATWTPYLLPTSTPVLFEPSPTSEARPSPTIELSPTLEPTQPLVGPQLPTATPAITPTITPTPSSASEPLFFAVAGDSRDDPQVYRQVLEAVAADGSQFLVHTGDLVNRGTEAEWQQVGEMMAEFPLPFTLCRGTTTTSTAS